MLPGQIFLASFPFGDVPGMKLRPVLLLTPPIGPIPEVLVAYISSRVPASLLPTDLLIDVPAPQTGLKVPSVVRLHKQATLHRSSLVRLLGEIPVADRPKINLKLRSLLAL